ncbi:unnamed protein product [Cylindrotheca closterium]|uniref:Sulfotransferase domain-containing protein n=1 Tax=Cylindrotheca closterium TaxID=2856 RepID=A0AAD2CCM3_9STRA|nr:unnamed protein product [Cylindrotheca closterium]
MEEEESNATVPPLEDEDDEEEEEVNTERRTDEVTTTTAEGAEQNIAAFNNVSGGPTEPQETTEEPEGETTGNIKTANDTEEPEATTAAETTAVTEVPQPTGGDISTTPAVSLQLNNTTTDDDDPYPFRDFMFVHVGKAGGSSLMFMFREATKACQGILKASRFRTKAQMIRNHTLSMMPINKQLEDMTAAERKIVLQDQMCRIAFPPKTRTHIHFRNIFTTVNSYSNFIINVRNPVDRMVSWYYYERYRVKAVGFFKHSIPGQLYAIPFHYKCYSGDIGPMIQEVLIADPPMNGTDPKKEECIQLAKKCLRGDVPCYAHNFFNYETYLEELLLWKGLADAVNVTNATHFSDPTPRDVSINLIRTRDVLGDLNSTIKLWSGHPMMNETAGLYTVMNTIQGQTGKQTNKTLSTEERGTLCRFICVELVVYKKILGVADNLKTEDVQEEYDDLDKSCGFNVDEVFFKARKPFDYIQVDDFNELGLDRVYYLHEDLCGESARYLVEFGTTEQAAEAAHGLKDELDHQTIVSAAVLRTFGKSQLISLVSAKSPVDVAI